MKVANLPIFLQYGNTKKSDICAVSKKLMGGHETGGLEQNWGRAPHSGPGPKTATGHTDRWSTTVPHTPSPLAYSFFCSTDLNQGHPRSMIFMSFESQSLTVSEIWPVFR